MKVYIECIFILNFLIDYYILKGVSKVLNQTTTNKRIFLSCIIGSMTTFFIKVKISNFTLIIIKLLISIIMIRIAFGKSKIFQNVFYFYEISVMVGGFIYLMHWNQTFYINMILLLGIIPIILKLIIKEYKKYKCILKDHYQVKILVKNHIYQFNGFIDTGNHLKCPISKKSIILVDQDLPKEYSYFIPYKALNYEGVLEILKPDKIWIEEKEIKNCLVGLSKYKMNLEGHNCILPNSLKEEL